MPLAAAAGGGGGGAQSAFAFAAPAGFPPLETPGAVGRGAHPAGKHGTLRWERSAKCCLRGMQRAWPAKKRHRESAFRSRDTASLPRTLAGAAQPGSARAPGVTSSGTFAPALLHMPSATPSEDGAVHVAAAATRAMLALPRSDTIAVRVGGGAGGGATVPPSALRASQTLGTVPQSPNAGAMSPRGRAPPIAASSASQRNLSPVQSSSSGRERAGASGSPAETVREETYSQDGFASPATQSPHDEAPPRGLQQNAKQQANKPAPVQVRRPVLARQARSKRSHGRDRVCVRLGACLGGRAGGLDAQQHLHARARRRAAHRVTQRLRGVVRGGECEG